MLVESDKQNALTLFICFLRGRALLRADEVLVRAAVRPLAWRCAVAGCRLLQHARRRRQTRRRQSRRRRPGRGRPALRLPWVRLLVRSLLDHLLPARPLRQRAAELQRRAPLGAPALRLPPAWPQRGLDIAIGTIAKFRWGVHLRQAESGLVQDLERHSQITH